MKNQNSLHSIRKTVAGIFLLLCLPLLLHANRNEKAARALADRLIPRQASQLVFNEIDMENGMDVFEIESKEGKIYIRGNSANSMAVGLNDLLFIRIITSSSFVMITTQNDDETGGSFGEMKDV